MAPERAKAESPMVIAAQWHWSRRDSRMPFTIRSFHQWFCGQAKCIILPQNTGLPLLSSSKIQHCPIHAIAKTGRLRAIVKYMAEV